MTAFEYDKLGRETARILPDGARETREYDAAGNLQERTDFLGRTTDVRVRRHEPAARRGPTRTPAQNVSFTYTPAGRRRTATDARGITTYGYDVRDRLTSLTYPDGRRLEYGYDGNGNRATLTAVVGTRTIASGFTYDDAGRLDIVTDPAGARLRPRLRRQREPRLARVSERDRHRLHVQHAQPPDAAVDDAPGVGADDPELRLHAGAGREPDGDHRGGWDGPRRTRTTTSTG